MPVQHLTSLEDSYCSKSVVAMHLLLQDKAFWFVTDYAFRISARYLVNVLLYFKFQWEMLQQTQDPWVSREKHGMMVRASDFLKHLHITVKLDATY